MYHYRGYGLLIRSELELPELIVAVDRDRVDVEIRFGAVAGPMPPPGSLRLVRFGADGGYFAWPDIGRFHISSDGVVLVDPLTQDARALRFALLGPVFAGVLQLNKVALLHGSAVANGRTAIVFVGRKGAGKSTTAAAFAACGCEILNDDVLPLRVHGSEVLLTAGFPGLKLSPVVRDVLLPDWTAIGADSSPPAHKIVVSDPRQASGEFPVTTILVLDPEAPADPIVLSPLEALQELLQHGYVLKFGEDALGNCQGEALFETCTRLAHHARIIRVGRFQDLAQICTFASRLLASC